MDRDDSAFIQIGGKVVELRKNLIVMNEIGRVLSHVGGTLSSLFTICDALFLDRLRHLVKLALNFPLAVSRRIQALPACQQIFWQ